MSDYRIVSRSYPTRYWAEHGDEIIATANELHHNRWSFRESRQLAANGLRARSFEATGGELRRVWVQGLTIWLFIILLNMNRGWAGQLRGFDGLESMALTWSSILALLALVATAFSTRWPVLLLIAGALIASSFDESGGPVWFGLLLVAITTIPIIFFGDGRRIVSPTVLALLFAALTASTTFLFISPVLIGPVLLICGLAIVRLDARILAAATIHAITIASIITFEVLFPEPTRGGLSTNDSFAGLAIAAFALAATAVLLGTLVTWRTRLASRHF